MQCALHLTELFHSDATPNTLQQDGDMWTATWNDGDRFFGVFFRPAKEFPGAYDVSFSPTEQPPGFDFTTDKLGRSKSAVGVFGQVVAYIRQFLDTFHPPGLVFGAFEKGRKALYLRMLGTLKADFRQGGYVLVQPDADTLGIMQQRSRLYVQYQAGRLRTKVGDLQTRKRDWMNAKLQKESRFGITEATHPLVDRIAAFLTRYAKPAADYDADFDEPEAQFNGPDSAMLYTAMQALRNGATVPPQVNSGWSSGCYRGDAAAHQEHDMLVSEINRLARSAKPL
jgi:hypothetical protein